MTSNHPTKSTYTAPTCNLIIDSNHQQDRSNHQNRHSAANFTLHLDNPDRGKSDRVTLQGDFQQLSGLQQITTQYIAELVAKFPLPTINDRTLGVTELPSPNPDRSAISSASQLDDGDLTPAPNAENIDNEPDSQDQFSEESINPAGLFSLNNVSKLLGYPSDNRHQPQTPGNIARSSAATPQNPYLTGSDNSLEHQLHLGDLETIRSGAYLTLSAIQLFDLATVLDEYSSDRLNNYQQVESPTPDERVEPNRSNDLMKPAAISPQSNQHREPDLASVQLSRLPNLPKLPADSEHHRDYHRTERTNPDRFRSVIPWAAAAALAVATPFFFMSNPNDSPKQLTKRPTTPSPQSPNLDRQEEKSVTSQQPTTTPTAAVPPPTNVAPNPATTGLPAPWQTQPVQPPQNSPNLPTPSTQQPQNSSKIGIAALPPSILGTPTESPTPVGKGMPGNRRSPGRASATATQPGQINQSINPGKISVTRSLPILQDQPVTPPTRSIGKQNSILQPANNPTQKIIPASANPQIRQDVSQTTENAAIPQASPMTPLPKIDPRAVPSNPNLITSPAEPPSIAGAEPPTPQVIPAQPLPSNADRVGPDPADNSSLQETKRYFQTKWKAEPKQSSSLQYVLEVNGKSGVVQNVDPQGEAATNYLKQSKMIKPGQKLVSPGMDNSNQKIRVLLQPDGNVDTLIEP
jgi:hypothetical protein